MIQLTRLSKKVFVLALILSLSGQFFVQAANSSTVITDFDGNYIGKCTLTVTATAKTNPPRKFSTTQTFDIAFMVHNGRITGWASGSVLNKAGSATLTIPITGYGTLTITSHFSRNASTEVLSLSGTVSGSFPAASAVITGKFSGSSNDKFTFTIPSPILPAAKIGQKYPPGISFCTPAVPNGALCGLFIKSTNPSGGKPPYTFKLNSESNLLPTGMTLNASTGSLSGTPIPGQVAMTKRLIVCAYDSSNRFSGICRGATLKLNS